MIIKIAFVTIFIAIAAFIAFRFGLFGEKETFPQPITEIKTLPSPTISSPITTSPTTKMSTTAAAIKLLEAPSFATASEKFAIKWYIDSPKVATISHTAVHFGPLSKPDAKFPSDYPEKSAILKGTIPATFSAQLKISTAGFYYYRAHAIVNSDQVWSAENSIQITKQATASSTPTP